METFEEYLDAKFPEKYIISNFNETSDAEDSDRDNEGPSI